MGLSEIRPGQLRDSRDASRREPRDWLVGWAEKEMSGVVQGPEAKGQEGVTGKGQYQLSENLK